MLTHVVILFSFLQTPLNLPKRLEPNISSNFSFYGVDFSFTSGVHRLVWRNPLGDIFWGWFKSQGSWTCSTPTGDVLKCLSYIVRSLCGKVFEHVLPQNENCMQFVDSHCYSMCDVHSLCLWQKIEWQIHFSYAVGGLQRKKLVKCVDGPCLI